MFKFVFTQLFWRFEACESSSMSLSFDSCNGNVGNVGNVDSKAEDNRAWEINLFKYSLNFLNMEISAQEIHWIFK